MGKGRGRGGVGGTGGGARVRGLDGVAVTRSAWGLYRETRRPGAPGLGARVRALPRLLRDALTGRYPGVGPGKLAALTVAVGVYLLSPVDAVPDFLPVIGWGDDTALLLWFLMGLTRESGRYVEWAGSRSHRND
ncbi:MULTISPECIES: YkvA family protein [unclassified Kitasatospora]|uniref:YkvA family protein n=1 Tax=unclassified Kitasatospora TaxID=2633591 RepID=UPI003807E6E0